MNITLNHLRPGQSGRITAVGSHAPSVKRRLVDMGLTPGTIVTIRKIAPLGDPIEVTLRSYELSLRKEDAEYIEIQAVEEHLLRRSRSVYPGAPRHTLDSETLRRMQLDHEHELDHHPRLEDPSAHDSRQMKIALVGNPNCGKTTLFNALTGSNQYVGNWPGVTVEKKEGTAHLDDRSVTIVDLPGIYSLSPYSMEEIVARNFIIDEKPDAIIDILDATNLERNLYLTCQLLELERPMVIALNFMDEVERRGDQIDVDRLSKELGIPVVPITARTGENIDELLRTAHIQMHRGYTIEPDDLYDDFTHAIHHRIGELVHDRAYAIGLPAHWASIKLLEGDELVRKALNLDEKTQRQLDDIASEYERSDPLGDRETLIADSRYQYIERVVAASVTRTAEHVQTNTEKIDRIVTGKYTALPLFLLMMLAVFLITFGPFGSWLSDGVDLLINQYLYSWIHAILVHFEVSAWLISLVTDGILTGVGGVLVFLPQIALLFLFLSFLEDSGYMSRAAFIMDRLLRRFGLSGKAFIPMLMGFGCSVPAIMATRTVSSDRDRKMTILLTPYMSCSAKISIYAFFTAAFFPRYRALVMLGLYVLGILIGILAALIMNKTAFRGKPVPFVMELPNYRMPGLKSVALLLWEKAKDFLQRAFTVIFLATIIIWFLQSFDTRLNVVADSANSLLALIGQFIAPVFRPLGFGDWRCATALISGFIAKESVVSTLQVLLGGAAISSLLTTRSAISFLVFTLLYTPCVAAIATIRRELDSRLKTVGVVVLQCSVAWVVAFAAYAIAGLV